MGLKFLKIFSEEMLQGGSSYGFWPFWSQNLENQKKKMEIKEFFKVTDKGV